MTFALRSELSRLPDMLRSGLRAPGGDRMAVPVVLLVSIAALFSGWFIGIGGGAILAMAAVVVTGVTMAVANYRLGVWLLVLLLPFSGTALLPRQMFGITGLSPFNILFVFSFGTMMLARAFSRKHSMGFPEIPRILWVYVVLFIASAIYGSFSAHKASAALLASALDGRLTARAYLQIILVKPILILLVGFFCGMLAKSTKGAMGVFWSLVAAVVIMLTVEVVGIAMSGFSLSVMAGAHARGFLNWIGLHANQVGLFMTMGATLLLFSSQGDENRLRAFILFCLACGAGVGAALTFSRATFLGLMLVGGYFVVSRRQIGTAFAALVVLAVLAFALPDAFISRATTGITHGTSDDLSSGRVHDIWLPLLPEVLNSPLIGHGQRFVIWSPQIIRGEILSYVGHVHNAYLETLLDMGAVGLLIVGLLFHFMWKLFREMKTRHPVGLWRGYFEGASICILVLLVMGFTGEEFVPAIPQAYLWVSLGLALGFREAIRDGTLNKKIDKPKGVNPSWSPARA